MNETWKPVVGYESTYEVSNLGRIRSLARIVIGRNGAKRFWPECYLRQQRQTSGHLSVRLSKDSVKNCQRVHCLVMYAFIGLRPNKFEIRHLDGNPANNALSNLAYGTSSENKLDAYIHGSRPVGEKSHFAKLTGELHRLLMAAKGHVSSYEASIVYPVSDSHIRSLWRGEGWRHD